MLAELRKHLAGMLGRAAPAASPNVSVKSSEIARDRLAIILAHQRSSTRTTDVLNGVDMKLLQRDLLDCVKVTLNCSTPFLFHPPSPSSPPHDYSFAAAHQRSGPIINSDISEARRRNGDLRNERPSPMRKLAMDEWGSLWAAEN